MGERVEFPSNGHMCKGYFAAPKTGKGPAVVVIQEWWGLVPHIEDVVDRFAKEGFAAVAPDLYHGKVAKSPDEAQKLRMEVDAERAEREIAGAGDWLLQQPSCSSKTYGVVGFCMGGGLAQYAGSKEAKIGAVVSFYGGFKQATIDWDNLRAPILLIYGEKDQGLPPEQGRTLEQQLKKMGKNAQLVVYPGADHAFFNDARKEVYKPDAAADAWKRTIEFFRANVK
jgi:carboxymethylenebutenolidase